MEQQNVRLGGTSEREDLQEMLSNPGWNIFVHRTLREYLGPGYRSRMRAALQSADVVEAKVIDKLALEVERLLSWPQERMEELMAQGGEDNE